MSNIAKSDTTADIEQAFAGIKLKGKNDPNTEEENIETEENTETENKERKENASLINVIETGKNIPRSSSQQTQLYDIASKQDEEIKKLKMQLDKANKKLQENERNNDYNEESDHESRTYKLAPKYKINRNDSELRNLMTPLIKRNPKPMNPQQKPFNGKENENIADFLYSLEINMYAAHIEEQDKIVTALGYLNERAAQFAKQLLINEEGNLELMEWKRFKDFLINRFQSPNYKNRLLKQLENLKQKGNSIHTYIDQFTLISNQLTDTGESVKILFFIKNANIEISKELSYKNPQTLNEAINTAILFEESH